MEDSNSVSAWKSASLYIGDLPEAATESHLLEIFSVYGPLESVKVCRNWDTGQPLGYGFLNYENEEHAEVALRSYNFKPVLGKPCRLMWSTKRSASALKEDCAANIFVKGLAKSVDNQLLFDTFSQCGTVLSSRVARNKKNISLGYGYVSFASDQAASRAIKQINGLQIHGQIVSVERFVEKSQRVEKPWSNVHIMGIPQNWTKENLLLRFRVYGEIRSAVIMTNDYGVSRGFGFVDFVEHESAVLAVEDNHPMNLPRGHSTSAFEEKQRQSSFSDQMFLVKLRVTPALKKMEKTTKRAPRAGHNLGRALPSPNAVFNESSPFHPSYEQSLWSNCKFGEPGLLDTSLDFSLFGDSLGLGVESYPPTRKLNRSRYSSSTQSTFLSQPENSLFGSDVNFLADELNSLCLDNSQFQQSPPGFNPARF